MEPYEYEQPGCDVQMTIGPNVAGEARLYILSGDPAVYIDIRPAAVPAAALALYEAAGLPVPLILSAPERGGQLVRGPHGQELADVRPSPAGSPSNKPGVMLGLHDGSRRVAVRLVGDEPLTVAAALVSAMREAEAWPDPAEVEELATAIHRANCEGGTRCLRNPDDGDRSAARLVLLGGWKREPGQ